MIETFVCKEFVDKEAIIFCEAATEKSNQVLVLGSANDIHFIINFILSGPSGYE